VTLTGRLEQHASEGPVGRVEQVVTQKGEVEGGEQVPKSISALRQAWREEEKREWEGLWPRVHQAPPSPITSTTSLAAAPYSFLAFVSTSTT
jgi:hypothetical protein